MAPHDVLDFWFGAPGSAAHGTRRGEWFRKSDAYDREIGERFLDCYKDAAQGRLAAWQENAKSLLALIIVLDQFPRNMFRGDPRSFATDALALAASQRMMAYGWDGQLAPVMRMFVYLPFEHAESIVHQERAVQLFDQLAATPGLEDLPEWARRHRDVIARFGRFPHRNVVLGRVSTPEEVLFLEQPGSSF